MSSKPLSPTGKPIDARLELPGSKSFANRALVCAAINGAPCTIRNLSPGDDTALMLNVLVDLGWGVKRSNPLSADVALTPPSKPLAHPVKLFTGPAGTVTRFAAALLAVTPGVFTLDGNERMRERPMGELIIALRQLGASIDELGAPGCVPLRIEGGSLQGGACTLRGDVSSQFVSALLLAGPARASGIEITIEGELVSKPYVDITIEVMRAFGRHVERDGYGWFRSAASRGQGAHATNYACPPDGTAASYFWGAAAITGGKYVIDNLTRQDVQGDVAFAEILGRMGCEVLEFPNGLGVSGRAARAVEADLSALPDCAQTLAVVCAFAQGTSRLTGLGTLRVKETDRIAALQAELAKLGVVTRAGNDWLEIDGKNRSPERQRRVDVQQPIAIATYDDHRMAMSFALAGLVVPVTIEDPDCVSKSFPTFWQFWQKLA